MDRMEGADISSREGPGRSLVYHHQDSSAGGPPPLFFSEQTMTAEAFSNVLAERATSRSPRIPFPSGYVSRTQSEIELSVDKERAKQHELRMFHRLVNGIRDRQHQLGMVTDDLPAMNNLLPFPSFLPGSDLPPPSTEQRRPTALSVAALAATAAASSSSSTTSSTAVPTTTTKPASPLLAWLPATATPTNFVTTLAVPMTVQDDWSISGFENNGDDGSTATGEPALAPCWSNNNYHCSNGIGRPFLLNQYSPMFIAPAAAAAAAPWGSAACKGTGDVQQQVLHEDDQSEEDIFQLDF